MTRPTVAVWKFASCDGCQLTVLDCEDELLAIAAALDIRMFLEGGPDELLDHYDISFVEGSITTAHDADRIRDIRARTGTLVTIGACATAGGIQALRNTADVAEYCRRRLPPTRLDRDAGDEHADRRPCARSTTSCAAVRSPSSSCSTR